jgi:multidrug transporter EmrE-like cation transporter
MPTITMKLVLMFTGSIIFQVIGVTLIPISKGLTQVLPTIGVAICFLLGIGLMARLTYTGMNISVLIPLIATVVPLSSIVIGILLFGESASWARIGTLITACLLIGIASYF